jgi:NAD(P)H-dependent flavin oxidoreductase YrpB (nitropropane dioxygenase family)
MIWKTKITEITGIEYPVIMGAFGGWGKSDFASAFSNAGGLGIIAALNFPNLEDFEKDIQNMKKLTKKPFGINLSLPHHPLRDNKESNNVKKRYLDYIEVAFSYGIKIFTTSGFKAKFMGDIIHQKGGSWFHKCVLVKHAISAEKDGADAVTLVGLEGTGFKSKTSNTTLVNITMAKKLLNIPIIAAGGIGDARSFLAALAMGADAVCFGTALMMTEECPVSKNIKIKWLKINIFTEEFYKKIYHFNLENFMAPSTAIGHRKEFISVKAFISEIMSGADEILKSWGFKNYEFSTL